MNPLTQWGQWDLNPAGKWVQLQITNVEQFKGPFDEMWQEMITPKFKLDRSYKDNLESSHIG
jgi:hypothetical protein